MVEGQPLRVCPECGDMQVDGENCPECKVKFVPMMCHRCDQAVLSGEPRYTGGEYRGRYSHYECKKWDDGKLDRDLRNMRGKSREAQQVGTALADMLKRMKF